MLLCVALEGRARASEGQGAVLTPACEAGFEALGARLAHEPGDAGALSLDAVSIAATRAELTLRDGGRAVPPVVLVSPDSVPATDRVGPFGLFDATARLSAAPRLRAALGAAIPEVFATDPWVRPASHANPKATDWAASGAPGTIADRTLGLGRAWLCLLFGAIVGAWILARARQGERAQPALLLVAAVLVALGTTAPLAQFDSSRDLLNARLCWEGFGCRGVGPYTSVGAHHGGLWVYLLAVTKAWDGLERLVQVVVAFGHLGAIWAMGRTAAALRVSVPHAMWLATAGVVALGDRAVLWNPSVLPLPVALAWLAAACAMTQPGLVSAMLAGAAVALGGDAHMLGWALAPASLLAVLVATPRIARDGLGWLAGALVTAIGLSWAAVLLNVRTFLVRPAWLVAALIAGLGVLATLPLARRLGPRRARVLVCGVAFAGWLASCAPLLAPGGLWGWRYLLPIVPLAVLLCAWALPRLRWPSAVVAPLLGAALWAAWHPMSHLQRELRDVRALSEALARERVSWASLAATLEAPDCLGIANDVAAFYPWSGADAGGAPWRVALDPEPACDPVSAICGSLPGGRTYAIDRAPGLVDQASARLCRGAEVADPTRACDPIRPPSDGPTLGRNAHPVAPRVGQGESEHVRLWLPLRTPPEGAALEVNLVSGSVPSPCEWRVEAVRGEAHVERLDPVRVRLSGRGASGWLVLAPGHDTCTVAWALERPCIVERLVRAE